MLKCDFCNKTQSEVAILIAGENGSAICGACVLRCTGIILEKTTESYKKVQFENDKELEKDKETDPE